jgi:adenylylsulfate kinase-like enzyme
MVIWIIGLSGAGKTTLAEEVVLRAKAVVPNMVLIDGDVIRQVFGGDLDHSAEGRKKNATRVGRLCQFLDSQGIHVVCAILSAYESSRQWNRANLPEYFEVFIDAPMENLVTRDSKGLYRGARSGAVKNVVGVDLAFEAPARPDMVIRNDGDRDRLLAHAVPICERITRKK